MTTGSEDQTLQSKNLVGGNPGPGRREASRDNCFPPSLRRKLTPSFLPHSHPFLSPHQEWGVGISVSIVSIWSIPSYGDLKISCSWRDMTTQGQRLGLDAEGSWTEISVCHWLLPSLWASFSHFCVLVKPGYQLLLTNKSFRRIVWLETVHLSGTSSRKNRIWNAWLKSLQHHVLWVTLNKVCSHSFPTPWSLPSPKLAVEAPASLDGCMKNEALYGLHLAMGLCFFMHVCYSCKKYVPWTDELPAAGNWWIAMESIS